MAPAKNSPSSQPGSIDQDMLAAEADPPQIRRSKATLYVKI